MKKFFFGILILGFIAGCGDRKNEYVGNAPDSLSMFVPGEVKIQSNENFSLVMSAKDSLFILGNRPPGQTIYLLNNETGQYWKCRTGSNQTYFEELSGGEWELTPTLPQPDTLKRFDISYSTSGKFRYDLVKKERITDSLFVEQIDQQIKLSGYIDTLLSYDDAFLADSVIGDSLPAITTIHIPGQEAFVITYSYMESLSGPQMMIINNRIFPLTGPCSYEYVYPFQIDNRFFIQTGSSCCECGWVIDQVFEVSGESLILVFQDDSYST